MTKDNFDLTNSLPLLFEAYKHINKYPSVAPDSGTEKRTGMYLLMRLLNNISQSIEIPATMMASHNLGFENTYKIMIVGLCSLIQQLNL